MRVYEPFACGESISRYVAATEPGGTNVKCRQTDPYDRFVGTLPVPIKNECQLH